MKANGQVDFADVQVGNVVAVADYYNNIAVGIVEEKKENKDGKSVGVRFGFDNDLKYVIIEDNIDDGGIPAYSLISIIKSYA
jgi:hypothetical protein